ncbi:SH3 domain-containing protein [Empedobacter falsenii]
MKSFLLIVSILLFSCKGTSQESNDLVKENHQINFTDLFNEGTIIKFTPDDLDIKNTEIQEFKKKLEIFNTNTRIENFDKKNLSYLINNETFFDTQYYTNSSWLQYFIIKYKIDVTKLNDLIGEAIIKEDFNTVEILLKNQYIVSKKDLKVLSDTEVESKNKILENKTDGYESYIVINSKIDKIDRLLKNSYARNHIEDLDGYTNLRKEKNVQSAIIQQIKSGEHIEVLDNSSDWFLIQTKEGNQGYVHKSRIKNN